MMFRGSNILAEGVFLQLSRKESEFVGFPLAIIVSLL